jgi:hypothetical protein
VVETLLVEQELLGKDLLVVMVQLLLGNLMLVLVVVELVLQEN